MTCFVIKLGNGHRYLAHARTPAPHYAGKPDGWRPFVWVADLIDAEKFGSEAAALLFTRSALNHQDFAIVEIKAQPGPGQGVSA